MKKTWYRLTLDVAYERDIVRDDVAIEVMTKVIKHDLDVALRATPSGPVDWDLVNVEKK